MLAVSVHVGGVGWQRQQSGRHVDKLGREIAQTVAMAAVVGRELELAQVEQFLAANRDGLFGLMLEGEAGIGKSTVWLAALERAREQGLRVLSSRPAEAERGLAYVGLGDLLEPVLGDVLPKLAIPRRRALEVALLLEEPDERADARAVGVAVRSAIEVLADRGRPVIVAIDDVQWLDRSSADSLSFAFRRLESDSVLVLLARRLVEPVDDGTEISLAVGAIERMPIGPLSLDAVQGLLRARLGRTFGRLTLLRIHEASGGNPFYALEIAASLAADFDPTQPLPVPESLEGFVRKRLEGLPSPTLDALALISAVGRTRLEMLEAAGVARHAVEPALAARIVQSRDEILDFTHPLFSSVVYQGLTSRERRLVHGRLAEVVDEPLARARHLALSSEGSDEALAAFLEEEATRTRSRGAPIAAAELAEHALRLTPDDGEQDRHRRALAAARSHFDAGEPRRARTLAQDLLAGEPTGRRRAEVLVLLSDIEGDIGLRRQALDDAADDPALQARVHQWLAWRVRYSEGLEAAEAHARASLKLADSLDDDELRAGALAAIASIRFRAGDRDAIRLGEQAYALATNSGASEERLKAGFELAGALIHSAELEPARELLAKIDQEWSERAEWVRGRVLSQLGLLEVIAGRFTTAADYLDRAAEIGAQYDQEDAAQVSLAALIAAYRGDLSHARELAERARALAQESGSALTLDDVEGVLGVVELWSGQPERSIEHFVTADTGRRAIGFGEPGLFWWQGEHIEALLEVGRVDDATDVLDRWQSDAEQLGRARVLPYATQSRALVASARGQIDEALVALERAVEEHAAAGNEFGRARALLALGVLRRRARLKRAAREAIEAAATAFETTGALAWGHRARAELGRLGGRTRSEGLTPAERRVAALVAEGHTNREVAAALFLGERTVASHLSRVYAKLGIRSRTELARRLD
jgi:DNA-binding CsgD family transcriptional regulator